MELINLKQKVAELDRLTLALKVVAEQAGIMEAHPSDVIPIKKAEYLAVIKAAASISLTTWEVIEKAESKL